MEDRDIIRRLAADYFEHTITNKNLSLRRTWTDHNSFKNNQPLILVGMALYNVLYSKIDELVASDLLEKDLECQNPKLRDLELSLRWKLYHMSLGDDSIFEPYLIIPSVKVPDEENRWGVPCSLGEHTKGGASRFVRVIEEMADIDKILPATHKIDREKTNEEVGFYSKILSGIMPVFADDKPVFFRWTGDISTDLAKLVGLEELYYLMYDEPEMLHKLLKIMQLSILNAQEKWEKNGECKSLASFNQAMPYSQGIASMESVTKCKREDLFMFFSAQEFTSVSSDMFEEFCLNYQLPIMEKYGQVAYGCCEDLTNKLDVLLKIKNLRRVSVSPFAKPKECAEKIGDKFLISYRPNPSNVSRTIDESVLKKEIGFAKECFEKNNCTFDIDLKDVHTVGKNKDNLKQFVEITRKILST